MIEAVPERMEIKQAVFAELDAATPGHAILASNTSSLSITEIGEATLRPEKVVGFHYFYPASVMPLIEIVEGDETSPETVAAAVTFAQAIRKQPITCAEVPGFVVNRILNAASLGDLARAGGEGPLDQADRRGRGRGGRAADGPVLPGQPARPRHGAARGRAPRRVLRQERFYVPKGMQKLVADGKLGAKTGGDGFYSARASRTCRARPSPTCEELVERSR